MNPLNYLTAIVFGLVFHSFSSFLTWRATSSDYYKVIWAPSILGWIYYAAIIILFVLIQLQYASASIRYWLLFFYLNLAHIIEVPNARWIT